MAKAKGEFWKVTFRKGQVEIFYLTDKDPWFGWGGLAVKQTNGEIVFDNLVRFPFGLGREEECLLGIYECLECGQIGNHRAGDYICEKCRDSLP